MNIQQQLPNGRGSSPRSGARAAVVAVLGLLCAAAAYSQAPTGGAGAAGSTRPSFLPQSGRVYQPGTVATQQTAQPGSGVSTINSSIQVGGDFAGSVPGQPPQGATITLSLADAVKRGLAVNLAAISSANSVQASGAARRQELSALLPNLSANASETVTQVNLAAYGFQFKLPPGLNFSIPSVVGPFWYSSLTGSLSQSVYDPVQRRNYHASKETERAAILSAKDARELIVLAVGGTYLQTLASEANVISQRAQVENAQAVYNQAETRKAAGTNAKIDVMRSLVELETQKQRLTSLEAELQKQKIVLARVIGAPLDRQITLSEPLTFQAPPAMSVADLVNQAVAQRSDMRAAEAQVRAAEQIVSAAHAERWPSLSINGDYGVLGPTPMSNHGVFAITGAVNVPIWQGGRTEADIQQAESTLKERRAELADERAQVEQDVRTAFIELEAGAGQVKVAEANRGYAHETLNEARDRFEAGVANTVEVVQAQEQVAGADNDYVASLYSYNLAKLALARATGDAEKDAPDLMKGGRP